MYYLTLEINPPKTSYNYTKLEDARHEQQDFMLHPLRSIRYNRRMRLEFSIYRNKDLEEFNWGWKLLDKDKQDHEVARSLIFSQKGDNLEFIQSIIFEANNDIIRTRKLGNKKSNKSEKGILTLNIKEDNTWYMSDGEHKLIVGTDLLPDRKDIKIFLEALGKAKPEFLNPEDDPANQSKNKDDTRTNGVAGS